jgi:hypothetical protein
VRRRRLPDGGLSVVTKGRPHQVWRLSS